MWSSLPKPFFALAPMADVTDYAFRAQFVKHAKPDLLWTEFVSADGLMHPDATEKLRKDLLFAPNERPIIAQLFTAKPEVLREAVGLVRELGFDSVDINMGCPDRSVEKQGSGADCIRNPERALALIRAAQGQGLEVSVKTRLGYGSVNMEWIRILLTTGISALTVHLRTRNEMSKVPARWELMKDIAALRDEVAPDVLLIGNGDITSHRQGLELAELYGIEGLMVGRGAFGNPWFFSDTEPTVRERLETLAEHIADFDRHVSHKPFVVMKKHFKAYVNGFDGATALRAELMETSSASQAQEILHRAARTHEYTQKV